MSPAFIITAAAVMVLHLNLNILVKDLLQSLCELF